MQTGFSGFLGIPREAPPPDGARTRPHRATSAARRPPMTVASAARTEALSRSPQWDRTPRPPWIWVSALLLARPAISAAPAAESPSGSAWTDDQRAVARRAAFRASRSRGPAPVDGRLGGRLGGARCRPQRVTAGSWSVTVRWRRSGWGARFTLAGTSRVSQMMLTKPSASDGGSMPRTSRHCPKSDRRWKSRTANLPTLSPRRLPAIP